MKNLVLELNHCIGYGYITYIEADANRKVIDFLNDFSMWHGSTKIYKNYKMYELSEDCINFMKTPLFNSFLVKNNVNLITSDSIQYQETIKLIFNIE